MVRWVSRERRARISAGVAQWFSPQGWHLNDQIIGVAAAVLAISVFLPWYKAGVRIGNSTLNAQLLQPRGTASGLTVHPFLWALFGLAVLQFVVLVARYARSRRPRTIPGYGPFMLVTSAICFVLAITAFVEKPHTWYGNAVLGGPFQINVGWDYGAVVAVIATVATLVVAWTVLRDPAAR